VTSVKLDAGLMDGVQRFIADRDVPPQPRMDVAAAVNVIVRDWLQGQGYAPLPDDPSEITPALDAAEVPQG